ncbi:MAG TPA: Tol-Pal system beta propeller repeat protein TolB [Allosphingosinicella sp.]|jgi:TolB protein
MRIALLAAAAALVPQGALAQETQSPAAEVQPAQSDDDVIELRVGEGVFTEVSIAVPAMPTPASAATSAGETGALGRQVAQIVATDLTNSGLFRASGPGGLPPVSYPQVTSPDFGTWSGTGAQTLVQGFVRSNPDGTLTVGCYLYDVAAERALASEGFTVQPQQWRRAAHRCADMIYGRLTGESGLFDSRVVYVAESGPPGRRVKRLAIMDQDGANHRFLTNGQFTALTPRLSPDNRTLTYMIYTEDQPRVFVYDLASGRSRPLVAAPHMTFAPRFSPDGRQIVFSMAVNGNTDIYRVSAAGGTPVRLTSAPGIDTGGSFSPDGSRIAFESDRSGGQQIYVMSADGSGQRRISFGGGRYATPVWSPRGDLIAFTRIAGNFRIGVMQTDGSGERLLTNGWHDEGPSWAPNGRVLIFFRSAQGSGRGSIWAIDAAGGNERRIVTPLDGSDPAWSALND